MDSCNSDYFQPSEQQEDDNNEIKEQELFENLDKLTATGDFPKIDSFVFTQGKDTLFPKLSENESLQSISCSNQESTVKQSKGSRVKRWLKGQDRKMIKIILEL